MPDLPDFPASGAFDVPVDPADLTAEDFADLQEQFLAATKLFPGAQGSSTLTLASGVIIPTRGYHLVAAEGAAATDDLTHIQATNMRDGGLLLLRAYSNDQVITLKHNQGGAGEIYLVGEADVDLDSTSKFVWFIREGGLWREVFRGYPAQELASQSESSTVTALDWFMRQVIGGSTDGVYGYGSTPTDSFKVEATSPASTAVTVKAGGAVVDSTLVVRSAGGNTSAMSAPTANPRIDRVVLYKWGTVTVLTGTEAASPSAPTEPADAITLATIYHRVGETAIYDSDTTGQGYITDGRTYVNL